MQEMDAGPTCFTGDTGKHTSLEIFEVVHIQGILRPGPGPWDLEQGKQRREAVFNSQAPTFELGRQSLVGATYTRVSLAIAKDIIDVEHGVC